MLSSYKQIGQNHLHFEELDSTNVYAADLLAKTNPIDGTVISADFQTAGKGQYDRKWLSNKGENIIMSIILLPDFLKASQQIYLNIVITLGINDYLKDINSEFSIKWPNDIYHQDCKIAGILIQNQLQGESIKSSIIGIGLNLNQTLFDPLLKNPTSLKKITELPFNPLSEMKKLWFKIEQRYNILANGCHFSALKNDFEMNMYGINKNVKYRLYPDSKSESGIIKGINEVGKLIVINEQNQEIQLVHGEVELNYG
jgi:BirA family transcriptional regulator, biotin operon repressor / biotin---[acetyl-CoA-carboxylase] ligase